MASIRQRTEDLRLGITAFFPGGMTEAPHKEKYDSLLETTLGRLRGAAIEFELLGTTLRDIASTYEEQEEVTSRSFTATEEQLEEANEEYRGQTGRTPGSASAAGGAYHRRPI